MLVRWISLLTFIYLGLAFRTPAPEPSALYADRPLPGHTGGFDEPTCRACHFGEPLDAPGGALAFAGVPERYEPGETYRITVELKKPGMQRGGFQLAGRFAEGAGVGKQAGTWRPVDTERIAVTRVDSSDVEYAHHTPVGTTLVHPDSAKWTLEWTAPEEARGAVVFHAAANAANDDASAFGDFIYTQVARSRAP